MQAVGVACLSLLSLAALVNSISLVHNQNQNDRPAVRLSDLAKNRPKLHPSRNSSSEDSAEQKTIAKPLQRVVDYLKQRNEDNWLSISLMSLMPSESKSWAPNSTCTMGNYKTI